MAHQVTGADLIELFLFMSVSIHLSHSFDYTLLECVVKSDRAEMDGLSSATLRYSYLGTRSLDVGH